MSAEEVAIEHGARGEAYMRRLIYPKTRSLVMSAW